MLTVGKSMDTPLNLPLLGETLYRINELLIESKLKSHVLLTMKTVQKTILLLLLFLSVTATEMFAQSSDKQDAWQSYGEQVTEIDALGATEAIAYFTEEGKKLKVQGTVTAVCDKVGCWAQFDTENDESIRIKFKDFSFFIPTESAGKIMIAEGIAFKRSVSDSEDNATRSVHEYELIAGGVLLK